MPAFRTLSSVSSSPVLALLILRVCSRQLRACGTGHSERRTLFHETSDLVADKTRAAITAGLSVILCVGETLEEREAVDGAREDRGARRVVERRALVRVVPEQPCRLLPSRVVRVRARCQQRSE